VQTTLLFFLYSCKHHFFLRFSDLVQFENTCFRCIQLTFSAHIRTLEEHKD
jgi:hypothetical protein